MHIGNSHMVGVPHDGHLEDGFEVGFVETREGLSRCCWLELGYRRKSKQYRIKKIGKMAIHWLIIKQINDVRLSFVIVVMSVNVES